MTAALPTLSFICAFLFSLFLCADRVRATIPNLSLVTWFLVCNLIHGINSVVWEGNVDIKIPVWCDISTRLILGSNVGLPAAFVCIARKLELASSQREIPADGYHKRVQTIIDVALCIVFPIIYISLHYIAQDHRFDLVKELGCFAAIHPSSPALVIVWLPPLLTCSAAILFCGITIHNSFRISTSSFSSHVSSRSNFKSSLFIRTLIITLITSAVLALTSLFALFSPAKLSEWTSWQEVHRHFYEIEIIVSKNELTGIQFAWWGLKAVSIVYLVLLLALGEEVRDGVKWLRGLIVKWNKRKRRSLPPVLMMHAQQTKMVTHSSPRSQSPSRPLTLELKSGWDDMLDFKMPKSKNRSKLSLSPSSARSASTCPSLSPCASPTPSTSPSSHFPEDDSFAIDTLNYLNTPVAQSLGLKSPPLVYASPQKTMYNITPWRRPISPHSGPMESVAAPIETPSARTSTGQTVPEDAKSTVSSIWEAPWPEPPSAIPGSPAPSSRIHSISLFNARSNPQSRCTSPSAMSDPLGLPILSSTAPTTKPFQGPSVEVVEDSQISDMPVQPPPRHPSLKRLKSLDGLGNGVGRGSGSRTGREVIYMTVVKEVV